MTAGNVSNLTLDDLDWVLELTQNRRQALVPHAPVFWRPARDASSKHAEFLRYLIEEPGVLTVRNDAAFLIAMERGPVFMVDDAVVSESGTWHEHGVQLLRYAQEHCGALRFVVPVFEGDRLRAAAEVGLHPVENWWHKNLPHHMTVTNNDSGQDVLEVDGAAGRLVPAPPVYDPGGPVLLVTKADSDAALANIEQSATRRGVPVSVVTQLPGQVELESILIEAGYTLTTAFCEGAPAGA